MPVRQCLLAVLVTIYSQMLRTSGHKVFCFLIFFCRKPGLTGRGLYELKPECAKNFNLYFYHFSRAEQSKVSSLTSWGLFCAFIFLFAFFQSLLLWRSITSWILENLPKIFQWFLCHWILCPIQSYWNQWAFRSLSVGSLASYFTESISVKYFQQISLYIQFT